MTAAAPRPWPAPIRALGHAHFRRYFAGQAVSILGSWIQQVAMAWLVYRLTGSAALLGVTAFAALIPQLLVGPFAGAWVDKHDKRRAQARAEETARRLEAEAADEEKPPVDDGAAKDDPVLDEGLHVLSDLVTAQQGVDLFPATADVVPTDDWLRRIFQPL